MTGRSTLLTRSEQLLNYVCPMPDTATAWAPPAGGTRRRSISRALDDVFFVVAGWTSVWLAYLVLTQGFSSGWAQVWFYLMFWLLLAYVALPRLHRILTYIYVPDYFIGRTRTSDGLLGDPVNLALLGSEDQVHSALIQARWTRADDLSVRSAGRIIVSTILRRSYGEAPVSPLMLFGRNQDFAYQQEVRNNPARRHHVRFWRCPDEWLLPGGHRADWLAAATYDRAVGLSLFTLQITHKIDENTDVERDHVVDTLLQADPLTSFTVLEDFATGYHSRNGGGDAIVTDGNMPVLNLRGVTVSPQAQEQSQIPVPTPITAGVATGAPDKVVRRPAQTVFGAVVVLLRAVTPLLVWAGAALGWSGLQDLRVVDNADHLNAINKLDPFFLNHVLSAVVYLVFEVTLGLLVLFGSNLARIAVMAFSVVSIAAAAMHHLLAGQAISFSTNLVAISLDILILVALSSGRAREYSNRPRDRRASPRLP